MLDVSPTHFESQRAWWGGVLGKVFLESEELEIKEMISQLFGYHLLMLGEPNCLECVKSSPIMHRIWLHPNITKRDDCSPLSGRQDKLPIVSDGIDLIYLAHSLEFIQNPHEVLRETFRSLIPGGSVVVSGFNPWSMWGGWRWIARYVKRAAWDGNFITIARLKDWLSLLGFDVLQTRKFFFRPPVTHPGVLNWLKWLETLGALAWPFLGGGYVLLAQKRVLTLTPIKPAFEKSSKLLPVGVVEPAARAE